MFFVIFAVLMLRYGLGDLATVIAQFQSLLIFFACYNLFLTRWAVRGGLLAYAFACGLAALLLATGMANAEVSAMTDGRLTGLAGSNENAYSQVLGVGVLLAIGVAHIRKEKTVVHLFLLWAIILLAAIFIVRAGSRGQTLALAVGVAIFILRKGTICTHLANVALMTVIGIAGAYLFLSSDVLKERWAEAMETGSTSGRTKIYRESIGLILEKPLIGWSASGGEHLASRLHVVKTQRRGVHNHLLTMLLFTGLAGSIPYFWGYLTILRNAWWARRGIENVLPLALFVTLFIGDFISGGLPEKLHWSFFAYMLAAGTTALAVRPVRRAAKTAPRASPICQTRPHPKH
ncbi:MAG: O-antigen ligase family protein [Phycisphaerales bacterium]